MVFDSLLAFFSNPLLTGIAGAVAGIAGTLVTKFGEAFIKETFENRKERQLLKRQAATDIMSFCLEGMRHGFRKPAGSEHHIRFRANQIEAIDEVVGKKLDKFAVAWTMHRNIIKNVPSLQTDRTALQYRDEAQQLGQELLVTAKQWVK